MRQEWSQALKICKCLWSLSCGGVSNMMLVLSITFVIVIDGVVCVQLAHFSLSDWKDISIAHVIIIIKSEVSTLPIVIIFFRGCVPEMFVTSYSVTYCIYIPEKLGFCFHYYCTDYDQCKLLDTFWLADRVRLFVHYTISLSPLCKLIWIHWTYKIPVRYILSNVWVRLSIFFQLSIIQYMGLCVFNLPISLVMIERIYTLSYYHHQIGSMINYPLFAVRSWDNGMRCMFLYIFILMTINPWCVATDKKPQLYIILHKTRMIRSGIKEMIKERQRGCRAIHLWFQNIK